jgi:hypothetical protein
LEEEIKKRPPISEETRRKQREAKLRNPVKFWLGKTKGAMPQEQKDKIRQALKGRKLTDEHKKHMLEARIRYLERIKQEKI